MLPYIFLLFCHIYCPNSKEPFPIGLKQLNHFQFKIKINLFYQFNKVANIKETNEEIPSVAVLSNNQVVYGTNDYMIYIRDLFRNYLIKINDLHNDKDKSPLLDIIVLGDGKSLITSSHKRIKIWISNSSNWQEKVYTINLNVNSSKILLLKNGNIVSLYNSNQIKIWNPNSAFVYQTLIYHSLPICDLVLMNRNFLASVSIDSKIVIWNLTSKSIYNILDLKRKYSMIKLAVLANNDLVVATDKFINVWDVSSGLIVKYLSIYSREVLCMIVLKNDYLVSSFGDLVEVYDTFKSKIIHSLKSNNETITSLTVLDTGFLVGGTQSGQLIVWKIKA